MDRMQFLKAIGVALGGSALVKKTALAGTLLENASPNAAAPRFRPGPQGQILVSKGNGGGWTVHADFGSSCEVLAVRQDAAGTRAELRFQGGHTFPLGLDANGRDWKVL